MRIIKQGKLKPTQITYYVSTCPYCDCEFEFMWEELKQGREEDDIQDGPGGSKCYKNYNYISCPTCKREVRDFTSRVKYE